jgi:RibD C-terminal domain
MLRCEIDVRSGADRLLYEGLPLLAPVLDELGDGALLIGGLATAVWLTARPVGLPVRATRDIDLGIDRRALGITRERTPVKPLLRKHEFDPGYAGEEFRFARKTSAGTFVVDLLVCARTRAWRGPGCRQGNARLAEASVAEEVAAALDATDKPVSIGGAGLAAQAFELGLVDELRMFRHPVVIGGGTPFLPPVTEAVPLDLIETSTFGSRVV